MAGIAHEEGGEAPDETPSVETTETTDEPNLVDDGQEPVSPAQTYEMSDHGKAFIGPVLEEFPEELHPKLEEVLKRWDAGANLKFTEYQEQIKPYQELGDVDQIKQAVNIVQQIRNDPAGFRDLLSRQLGEPAKQQTSVDEDDEPWSTPLAEFRNEQEGYMRSVVDVMQGMYKEIQELKSVGTQGAAEADLERKLNLVKTANPDVDEGFVKDLIGKGHSIDEAISLWSRAAQSVKDAQGKRPPVSPTLPGSGSPPTRNDVTPGSLSDAESDDLVVQALKQIYNN